MYVIKSLLIGVFFIIFNFGCSEVDSGPKVDFQSAITDQKGTALIDYNLMVMDEKEKAKIIEESRNDYRLKVGDKLVVSVYKQPDFSTSLSLDEARKTIVHKNGTIQLPQIGIMYVLDLTVREVRDLITEKLKKFLLHPDVIVSVGYHEKNRYYLVGEFSLTKSIETEKDYKYRLLELISEGGGIKRETADLRKAYIARNNKKLPVNLYRLIEDGDLTQNIEMQDKDVVVIPRNTSNFVYVFSSISQAMQGKVPLIDDKITLTQAIAISNQSTGLEQYENLNNIYVVRTEIDRIETFVLDAEKMFKGQSMPFYLMAGDIVYISKSKMGTINTVINYLFPVLEVIQATMNDINVFRNTMMPLL